MFQNNRIIINSPKGKKESKGHFSVTLSLKRVVEIQLTPT